VRKTFFWPVFVILCTILPLAAAAENSGFEKRFETVWELIDERYWNHDVLPEPWSDVHDRYAPQVAELPGDAEDRYWELMEEMYEGIADDHTVFVRPSRVAEIRELYGTMPCLALLGQADLPETLGTLSYGLQALPGAGSAGVIRIPDFASDYVAGNLRRAVRELEAEGADGFVLDIRGNPGGRLVTMMQSAGVFTSGLLWRLVTTWSLPIPYPAIGVPETDAPLALLTDRNVHSAAEGFAGALRQSGRAVTVGEASAGNVEALLPFCLRDGSQAWVAAGVLAPLGAPTWQNTGVEPDVEIAPDSALEAALDWLKEQLAQDD